MCKVTVLPNTAPLQCSSLLTALVVCGKSTLHAVCGLIKTLLQSYKNTHFKMMHCLWGKKLMSEIDIHVDVTNANDVDEANALWVKATNGV